MVSERPASRKDFEVLVVGAGPAGLAAAACAAESGAVVGVVDDNPSPGGQIWRAESTKSSPQASRWVDRFRAHDVKILCGTRVFHHPEPRRLLAEDADGLVELRYGKLIVATGAREMFLPFPGWTLPNVMGAGGLQPLVKSGLPIAGKRVLVAGSGPLLLAVAAYLREHGAEILMICEQAPLTSLGRFGLALLREQGKMQEGFSLRRRLSGIGFKWGSWPLEARGHSALEEVVISHGPRKRTMPCDYLACGFHLVPNTELAELLGCDIRDGTVRTDDLQQTSIPGIFCAGEPTGVGGLELALIEGQIAGFAAGRSFEAARRLFGKRRKLKSFARVLNRVFAPRPELRSLPGPETIICRCEDVVHSRLARQGSWRAAKLQTRCGMGPCQGRVCGPATRFLFGWSPESVRPPIFPARYDNLCAGGLETETEPQKSTGGHA